VKLLELYVDGYGLLHDFYLGGDELAASPCIIFGLNEAGKTTLLSFIRAVLFGFKSEGGPVEPVRGGRMGGYLLLEDGGEVYRVERYGRGNGKVVVEMPGGRRAGEEMLRTRVLRGVSPVLFKNVFAFGMDELRRLEELASDEVNVYIYGAGTGTRPHRLAGAAAALEKTAGELFRPRGRTQTLNKLLLELDGLDRQIRELEQQPARYRALQEELAELERERAGVRALWHERQRRLRRLENLIKAREPWNDLQACLAGLQDRERIASDPARLIAFAENDAVSPGERLEQLEQAALELERLRHTGALRELQGKRLEEINHRLRLVQAALRRPAGTGKMIGPFIAAALLACLGTVLAFFETTTGLVVLALGIILAALTGGVLAARSGERRAKEAELRGELEQLERSRESLERELQRLAGEHDAAAARLRRLALALTGRETLAAEEIPGLKRKFELHKKIKELRAQLLNLAGSAGELVEMERELKSSARADIEGEYRELETALAAGEGELARLGEEIAARKQKMKVLESGEELARARQRRDMLRESLAAGAREWQVAVLARALLEMAREKHERERQPAVLARASQLIGPMTAGRYARVVAPVGAAAKLEVEEPGGRRLDAASLSRGAAGQLYLAVRLALARHFSSVVAPMPVVLDDIMVDFDAVRLRGALRVLGRVARELQVILLTCHEHILAAAREQLPGFGLITMENGARAGDETIIASVHN
jgi:uncharacterized protein YhaN